MAALGDGRAAVVPRWRTALLALLLSCCSLPSLGGDWLLASTRPQVLPGEPFSVVVIAPAGTELPERIGAWLELEQGEAKIALQLDAAGPAAENGRRSYAGVWPAEVNDLASLVLAESASARLLLDGRQAPPAEAALVANNALVFDGEPIAPATAAIAPVEASALGFHEPMYFLAGGKSPVSARFQFSFRYRIFDDHGVVGEHFPLGRGLYFGFTQTSLWDLQSDSRPFRDSSFRPALFYRWRISPPASANFAALGAGYEHESNGKGGMDSRSIDTLFVKFEGRYHFAEGPLYLGLEPKLWTYLDRKDNPDIARYRGYAELGLRLGRDDAFLLTTLLRRGTAGKWRRQFDLSYPLRRSIFSGVGAFAHLQYIGGYGETLLEYDHRRHGQWRFGISLVR